MSKNESLVPIKTLLFSFHATNTIILSFLPLYLKFKGLNGTEIGWVLAIGPFASIVSQPFWGYLSDKYKTVKYILLVCVIGLLISSTIFFQMNSLLMILSVGAIFYFFTTPIGALGDSLAQRRANALGVSFGKIRMWGSIGFATSALIIGEILNRVGVQHMIWPYLFFGTIALIVVIRLKDVRTTDDPVHIRDVGKLLQKKHYSIFILLMIFITVTHRANDSFIGLYVTELGGTENLVGLAWFVGVISEAIVFAIAYLWFRKFHPIIFVIIAGAIYTVRWFIYGSIHDPMTLISFQVLHGITFGMFYLSAFDYVTRLIPKALQSTGHLIYYSVFFGVSGIIGSLAGGSIIEHFNGQTLYNVLGYTSLIGTIAFIIYYMIFTRKIVEQ
ncbi:MAG TPA: MFS transporter [Bacillota bacterium]|nr:MFS transporter [Bacillota bacterium]